MYGCLRCGVERVNRIAQDTVQPDDVAAIIELMPKLVPR